jgi:Fe2+ transport system protein FeoA
MTLNDLSPGDSARVLGINTSDAHAKRLGEMGFIPGTVINSCRCRCMVMVNLCIRGMGPCSRVAMDGSAAQCIDIELLDSLMGFQKNRRRHMRGRR